MAEREQEQPDVDPVTGRPWGSFYFEDGRLMRVPSRRNKRGRPKSGVKYRDSDRALARQRQAERRREGSS